MRRISCQSDAARTRERILYGMINTYPFEDTRHMLLANCT